MPYLLFTLYHLCSHR